VTSATREIGPVGTGARVAVGLVLLVLAFADQPPGLIWGLEPYELILGLVVLPAVPVTAGLVASRRHDGPLRSTGPAGIAANLVVIVVLFAVPYTAAAAALFYGASLLAAAVWGQPHCEATVLSNLMLRRTDQLGCPTFTPIDAMEARRNRSEVSSR
jgi:hypothetical protein